MNTSAQFLRSLLANEDGVTAIEYALLGALIAVVIMGSVALVGGKVSAMWSMVSNCVNNATTGAGSCP